jgi:hypothetical protein
MSTQPAYEESCVEVDWGLISLKRGVGEAVKAESMVPVDGNKTLRCFLVFSSVSKPSLHDLYAPLAGVGKLEIGTAPLHFLGQRVDQYE